MIKKIALLVCILSFGNVMAQTTPQEIVDSFLRFTKTTNHLKPWKICTAIRPG